MYRPKYLERLREKFSYQLSKSKNTVENAFGILANSWRIYHCPLLCHVDLCDKAVNLHLFCSYLSSEYSEHKVT